MLRALFAGILLIFIAEVCGISQGAIASRTVDIIKEMKLADTILLTSSNFPRCCLKDVNYYLRCPSTCGYRIVYVDVDLPPSASVWVHSIGNGSKVLASTTLGENGTWTRPSILYESSNKAVVSFHVPIKSLYRHHTGATVQVSTFNSAIINDWRKPDTTSTALCGSVHSILKWKGGEVMIKPVSLLYPSRKLDCIWVLKKPDYAYEETNVFIRFTRLNIEEGALSVRDGMTSLSPILYHVDTEQGTADPLNQGREGFISSTALFLRIKKSISQGYVTFVYGLFVRREKGDLKVAGSYCWMQSAIDQGGFFCPESKWCIPLADRCDGYEHCPKGEDEEDCESYVTPQPLPTEHSIMTTTDHNTCRYGFNTCPDGSCTLEPCPGECWTFQKLCKDQTCRARKFEKCPDECESNEHRCADGTCVPNRYSRCPVDCKSFQKKCSDGKCMGKDRYCSDQPCPSWKPHRCRSGGKCYTESSKCDRSYDCGDGSDEEDCNYATRFITGIPWYAYALIIFAALMAIMSAYLFMRKRRWRQTQNQYPVRDVLRPRRTQPRPQATESQVRSRTTLVRATAPAHVSGVEATSRTQPSVAISRNSVPADEATPSTPLTSDPAAPPTYDEAMMSPPASAPTLPAVAEYDMPQPPSYDSTVAANAPPIDTMPPTSV